LGAEHRLAATRRTPGELCALAEEQAGAAAGDEEEEEESPLIKQAKEGITRSIQEKGRAGDARGAIAELARMAELGMNPDVRTVTTTLDACVKAGNVDLAAGVYNNMFGENGGGMLRPDEMVFSIMVRGHGQQDPPRWLAISALVQSMERDYGIVPTAMTYNPMLAACARTNDYERGVELIDRMDARGVAVDRFTLMAVEKRKSLRSYLKKFAK